MSKLCAKSKQIRLWNPGSYDLKVANFGRAIRHFFTAGDLANTHIYFYAELVNFVFVVTCTFYIGTFYACMDAC